MKNSQTQPKRLRVSQLTIRERLPQSMVERLETAERVRINPAYKPLEINEYKAVKKVKKALSSNQLLEYEATYLLGEGIEGISSPVIRGETKEETAAIQKILRTIVQKRIDDRIEEDTGIPKKEIPDPLYAQMCTHLWLMERIKWFINGFSEDPLQRIINETEEDGYVYNNLPESHLYMIYRAAETMYEDIVFEYFRVTCTD